MFGLQLNLSWDLLPYVCIMLSLWAWVKFYYTCFGRILLAGFLFELLFFLEADTRISDFPIRYFNGALFCTKLHLSTLARIYRTSVLFLCFLVELESSGAKIIDHLEFLQLNSFDFQSEKFLIHRMWGIIPVVV